MARIPVATQIRKAVEGGGQGRFWRVTDFPDLPPAVVAANLARMRTDGLLKRYGQGLYYVPKKTILGEAPPPAYELMRHLARGNRVVPAGLSAYNRLGLTTQVPARPIFATSKHVDIDGAEIIIRDLSRYDDASDAELMVLDALAHIDRIPDCPPGKALRILCQMIESDWLKGLTLDKLAQIATQERPKPKPKIMGLLGVLGDLTGRMSVEWRRRLKDAMNPLTSVKLRLTDDVVPREKRREWQIA